jgi:hypothetical protein
MEKDKKTIKINRDENLQNRRVRPFCPQKERINSGSLENRTLLMRNIDDTNPIGYDMTQ